MKKTSILLIIILFLHNLLSCKSFNSKKPIIEINTNTNIIKINKNIEINLNNDIKDILSNFKYSKREMPMHEEYLLTDYHIEIQYNINSKKIVAVVFFFTDFEKTDDIYINKLLINDLTFKSTTSYEEAKQILDKKNIKYSTREITALVYIEFDNYFISDITYIKKNLKYPYNIGVLIN